MQGSGAKVINLQRQYCVSSFEVVLCDIIRKLQGSKKCPKFIRRHSEKKYGKSDNLARFWVAKFRNCHVGKYTYGYLGLTNDNLRKIGAFCSIANGVSIVPNDHRIDWVTSSPIMTHKDFGFVKEDCFEDYISKSQRETYIGNDVWIGEDTVIFEGVTIGDGAVIGANSVIRKNVPPYAVVVGVDKIIKYRFPPQIISSLLEIKWWEWDDEKIREHIAEFRDYGIIVKKLNK